MSDEIEIRFMTPRIEAYTMAIELARYAAMQVGREYNVCTVMPNVINLLNTEGVQGIVAVKDGRLLGGLMAGIQRRWWSDELVAHDIDLVLMSGGFAAFRKLLIAYREWAQLQGAESILLSVTGESESVAPVERVDKLYRYLGFERVGGIYKWAQQQS